MFGRYIFQMDVDDPSSWILHNALQDIFRHANPDNPQATFDAIQHVIERRNVEDLSQHPDSPYRHKPAFLVDGTYAVDSEPFERPSGRSRITVSPEGKRWDGGTWEPPPPKDWSKHQL